MRERKKQREKKKFNGKAEQDVTSGERSLGIVNRFLLSLTRATIKLRIPFMSKPKLLILTLSE